MAGQRMGVGWSGDDRAAGVQRFLARADPHSPAGDGGGPPRECPGRVRPEGQRVGGLVAAPVVFALLRAKGLHPFA
eukprot:11214755-Lingulodinium_polyedra.AAC.1